jgi:hypothetical protein
LIDKQGVGKKFTQGGQDMKRAICLLLMAGIFLIGVGSQALAENNKAEGITAETSISLKGEQSFFSKDNLNLLADNDKDKDKDKNKNKPKCEQYPNKTSCSNHPPCCWESSNSQPGHCVNCNSR